MRYFLLIRKDRSISVMSVKRKDAAAEVADMTEAGNVVVRISRAVAMKLGVE